MRQLLSLSILLILSLGTIETSAQVTRAVFTYNPANDGFWNKDINKIFVNPGKKVMWRIRHKSGIGSAMEFSDERGESMIYMNSHGKTGFGQPLLVRNFTSI